MKTLKFIIYIILFNYSFAYDPVPRILYQLNSVPKRDINLPDDACYILNINFNKTFGPYIKTGFIEAILPKATFENCYFKNIDFTLANLNEAIFIDCTLVNINFDFADLDYAVFKDCIFKNVKDNRARTKNTAYIRLTIEDGESPDAEYGPQERPD